MIVFYTKTCDGCSGNHALVNMKSYCKQKGVNFEERRTILWHVYEEEANAIMDSNLDGDGNRKVNLPFFYGTNSGQILSGNSFTPTDSIIDLIKVEKKANG